MAGIDEDIAAMFPAQKLHDFGANIVDIHAAYAAFMPADKWLQNDTSMACLAGRRRVLR